MKVIKKFVNNWWNHNLNEYEGWQEHKSQVLEYIKTGNKSLRLTLYKNHLDLINSKWGIQYVRTPECEFIRENSNKKKDNQFLEDLKNKIKSSSTEPLKVAVG